MNRWIGYLLQGLASVGEAFHATGTLHHDAAHLPVTADLNDAAMRAGFDAIVEREWGPERRPAPPGADEQDQTTLRD
ncbi:hypothetical protein [Paractinoplanes hotanensis]|uniref:Uncharacterized protein n=1 Tax=Paractinoplanes hotanensis TaxID=2906497 RepID=A0ABT0YBL3_9ACTN|nr:hypothetical protein [Actinoplanes hotanensis]MCM4083440.1 hypothetical protein [Actinoplanes hotanensis]